MKQLFLLLFLGTAMFGIDSMKNTPAMPEGITPAMSAHPIKVRYTNYRGETAVRTIVPISFYFGSTEYHKEEQWLVKLWDVERAAERIYALKEITQWFVQ